MQVEWYIPITFIPGIALLALSASNYVLDLNRELISLSQKDPAFKSIIAKKIQQLRRLSWAVFCLYSSIFLFSIAALIATLDVSVFYIIKTFLIAGIAFLSAAIALLGTFSLKAVRIREEFLQIKKN